MRLRLADVQGNVLRGYKHLHFAAYLLCRIDEARIKDARELLAEMLGEGSPPGEPPQRFSVMSAESWADKADVTEALNVAFTFTGLKTLGWGRRFEDFVDFREGMYERAEPYLHDRGESAREKWEPDLSGQVDVLFTLYTLTAEQREQRITALKERVNAAGYATAACQFAGRIEGSPDEFGLREHFGFRDGFSQPVLPREAYGGAPPPSPSGEGVLERPWSVGCRWRPLKLGEFLLGYTDEDGMIPGDPGAHSPHVNGTFMVWRKLRQDTEGFIKYVEGAAGAGGCPLTLQAKLVGRWPDGTSLVRAPYPPPPQAAGDREPENDFDYRRDARGAHCPKSAHVRRANPRTGLGWGTERAKRHRIIRRGLPYQDAHDDVGLIFVCFNASINRQFEQIQGGWLMDGDAFGLGGEQDLLLGDAGPEQTVTIQGGDGATVRFLNRPPSPLVTTKGGYYLFVPGMHALRLIASSSEPAGPEVFPRLATALGSAEGAMEVLQRLAHLLERIERLLALPGRLLHRLEKRCRVHN